MDGLKPVLEKLLKSELFNTIIPGRLYPTRTSHGKILELRVCKSPNSNPASADSDVGKKDTSVSCSDLRRTSYRHNYSDNVTNIHSTLNNFTRKNEDEIKLQNSKYISGSQTTSYSENTKGNRHNEGGSFKSTKHSYRTNSNINNSRNRGSATDDSSRNRGCAHDSNSGDCNDKTTHKILARSGSLIQEVRTRANYCTAERTCNIIVQEDVLVILLFIAQYN